MFRCPSAACTRRGQEHAAARAPSLSPARLPRWNHSRNCCRGKYSDFKAFISVADVPGEKRIGMGDDDPVFSEGVVTSVGAPIGLAVAETIATARAAADFIEKECITYDDLPAILTLDEAIMHNTAMPMVRKSKDPDEDVEQRIPSVTRPGSDLNWLANPAASLPGTEVVTGSLLTSARRTSTWKPCAPGHPRHVRPNDRVQLDAKPQWQPGCHCQGTRDQDQSGHGDCRANRRRIRGQTASGIIARSSGRGGGAEIEPAGAPAL